MSNDSSSTETETSENPAAESTPQPEFETDRLLLRPFKDSDADRTFELINDPEISANTRTIPYPYPPDLALTWIRKHPDQWIKGESAVFAVCLKPEYFYKDSAPADSENRDNAVLVGAIGLHISTQDQNAEIGYWIGKGFRGSGICTEAAAALVDFGFETLALHKIYAHFLVRNPASGRIMEKIGMTQEGLLKEHVRKLGKFEDVVYCGILNPRPGKPAQAS